MWQMDKHDADFYINSNQDQVFWIRFWPRPPPTPSSLTLWCDRAAQLAALRQAQAGLAQITP